MPFKRKEWKHFGRLSLRKNITSPQMSLSDDIQKLFTQQLDPEMRKLLLQRTKEMTQSQDLSNFKQCQIGDKIVPVCMYDVLRRLPLTSADPIF